MEIIKLIKHIIQKLGDYFDELIKKCKIIKEILIKKIDFIINNNHYYKYCIGILLTLVFILLVILINIINVPDKYIQIFSLLLGGIIISIFYFFVYRNEQEENHGKAVIGDNSKTLNHILYDKSHKTLVKEEGEGEKKKIIFDYNNFKNTIKQPITNLIKFFSYLFLSILLIVFIIFFIYYLYNNYQNLFGLTKIFLGFIIVITILAIIAKSLSILIKDCEAADKAIIKFLCIIKNFIFFIPCLLVIIADDINKDIRLTPSSVYLLFILLLFVVSLFIGLPMLFQFITSLNKHDLLAGKGPYYLDKQRIIGKYQDFSKEYKPRSHPSKYTLFDESSNQEFNIKALIGYLGDKTFHYKYTYSISFYLYLNPQPKNTNLAYNKETEIFNYANKPVVLYDGNKRKLLIKSKTQTSEGNQTDTIYETKKIKYQKWMLITINYENNIIDVFIDGKIVGSKNNVPPYFNDDNITIGEDNGIYGSIKDIFYYETPRPPNNIEFIYDLTVKPK